MRAQKERLRLYLEQRKREKLFDQISDLIRKKILTRSDKFREVCPGLDEVKWKNGDLIVCVTRLIRGDIVELREKDEQIIEYVDQSQAYSFLGTNDVLIRCDNKKLEEVLKLL